MLILAACGGADGPDVDAPNPPAGPRACDLLDHLDPAAAATLPGCIERP